MSTESLRFEAGLGTREFSAGARRIEREADGAASRVTKAFSAISSAVAAIGVGAAVTGAALKFSESVQGAMEMGKAMDTLGKQVGMTAGQARIFERQMDAVGMSSDDFVQAVGSLAEELEDGGGKLRQLGLDVEQLKQLDPATLFRVVGKAIGSIQDPLKWVSYTMGLFGEDAVKMVAAFQDPNFGRATGALAAQAALLDKNAARFVSATKSIKQAQVQLENFSVAAAGPIADGVTRALHSIGDGDITSAGETIGKKLGDAIGVGVEAVMRTKKLVDILSGATGGAGVTGLVGNIKSGNLGKQFAELDAPKAAESPDALIADIAKQQQSRSVNGRTFWKNPGTVANKFKDSPLDIWMSDDESSRAKNDRDTRRFGEKALQDARFAQKHMLRDPQDLLNATRAPNLQDPYPTHPDVRRDRPIQDESEHGRNFVRSRTKAERDAGVAAGKGARRHGAGADGGAGGETISLADGSIKALGKEIAKEIKSASPK